jgi:2-amino-4-hydroxy-6-hydroxymethyldihydropteridine diphosphokinase
MVEPHAFLSLGGNLGDVSATIAEALNRLDARGAPIVRRSSDYVTPPWGKLDQPDFVNVCAEVATHLTSLDLLRLCLDIERSLGRERHEKWGPRTIDIDLICRGTEKLHLPELTLPHPRLFERAFVLIPLLEIAPDLVIDGRSIAEAARAVPAQGIKKRR